MHETQWQLIPKALSKDEAFQDALLTIHHEIYNDFFSDDPLTNSELGFHLHAYRRTSGWRVVLILTPWMLSRLLFPENDPQIVIPEGWSGEERGETEYQVLGPSLRLGWSGDYMQAHLNYHPRLGHYLLQPISLKMHSYTSPLEAFEAWNGVINDRERT
ncbi:MAG: [NiFe]-hydrogenase assembly chaperone HybE [Candidatus Thiodiazotropha sp.]|nr:[NiFe]-hydrogenase assembly chaperone HybE [Candidatus Thiodiazotropha sp.]MCM8884442.1 [NiFe]-hydrogenase assembly chaperone HybE [Candidatus Thiodiazotropha sp.]MCM8920772.1 [NiFe]-hydrogenase assembly chaperone HybE [Candidatus Thiodiazotropha sp.]